MDLDPLVQASSRELAERFSIERVTAAPVNEWNMQTTRVMQRVGDTSASLFKMQSQNEEVRAMLKTLQEKNEALEATFETIDRLEAVVQRVKDTYAEVAKSVDAVERSVAASSASPLSLLSARPSHTPAHPYFPPPPPVDIYSSKDLFSP